MAKKELLKAYENLEFLHSPGARSIRVLCEFTEPQKRFRKHDVHNTIVFFGSARTLSQEQAQRQQDTLTSAGEEAFDSKSEYDQALNRAKFDLRMAKYYEDARTLARLLTEWSETIEHPSKRFTICSGGGPGIMEGANRGAIEGGGKSVGLNISLPFEQEPNAYQTEDLSFEFHYFFIRKFWFFYLAKAIVVFPGGFGTMDELFELLTLVQTEKTTKYMPIVIYGQEFWKKVVDFDALVDWGVISPEDLSLFKFFDDPVETFEYLRQELTRYYIHGDKSHRESELEIGVNPMDNGRLK